MSSQESGDDEEPVRAVVLDVLPRGRPEDDRPQYQKSPVALALGVADFGLYEMALGDDTDITIGDTVTVAPAEARHDGLADVAEIDYDDLSSGARSELEYAVEELVEADEDRFVDFYNEAQPVTLRMHQLDLLPGIGDTLRNGILDERDRRPFQDFADVEAGIYVLVGLAGLYELYFAYQLYSGSARPRGEQTT